MHATNSGRQLSTATAAVTVATKRKEDDQKRRGKKKEKKKKETNKQTLKKLYTMNVYDTTNPHTTPLSNEETQRIDSAPALPISLISLGETHLTL